MFFDDKHGQDGWVEDGFQSWNRLGDIVWHDKTICQINAIVVVWLKQNFVTILPLFEEEKEEVVMNSEVVNTLVNTLHNFLSFV